jgi:methylenetetrahydrofolate reductase (NADPH)
MIRLGKKDSAGAGFLVTQPVHDPERFKVWWAEVSRRGLHEKAAILAGIEPLGDAAMEHARAKRRPLPRIPDALLQQIVSKPDVAARRRAAIDVAVQTIEQLSGTKGLRGFSIGINGDQDAALEIIEKSALGSH